MQKLVFTNGSGQSIDLTSGNFGITNWEGLSGVDLNIQVQQVPFQDGGVFLDALMEQREITVTVAIQDNNDLSARYELKRQLISALNPKLGEGVLVYTNDYLSRQIKAVPQLPIFENKNSNDAGTLKANVTFSCPSPYWEDIEDTEINFGMDNFPIINNIGDIPAQMEIELYTNNATNPAIVNMSNKKFIKYNGLLQKSLYINTNVGQKKVVSEQIDMSQINNGSVVNKVVYVDELNMFLSSYGKYILYSYDGVEWNKKYMQTRIGGFVYYDEWEMVIATGKDDGKIYRSSDGVNWESFPSGFTDYLNDIVYSESLHLFVIDINGGNFLISSDGENWTRVASGIAVSTTAEITYSDRFNMFVVVGSNGTIMTSSDGVTWTSRTSGTSYFLLDVIYDDTTRLFVAVGFSGTILTSSNGVTWTSRTSGRQEDLNSVAYCKDFGMFIITGNNGVVLASSNGITWTRKWNTVMENTFFYSVTYSEVLHLLVISGIAGIIITSNNLEEWVKVQDGFAYSLHSVSYSKNLGVIVACGDSVILTSTNGENWIKYTSGIISNKSLHNVIYNEALEMFIVVGETGIILTSPDGITWTSRTSGVSSRLRGIAYNQEKTVIVGEGDKVLTSVDGITWTVGTSGFDVSIYNVVYSDYYRMFMAVVDANILIKSTDGTNWEQLSIQTIMRDIIYNDDLKLFVAVGDYGAVTLTDGDGYKNYVASGLDNGLRGVAYSSELNMMITVGENGVCGTSYDGITWEVLDSTVTQPLDDVIYNEQLNGFLIVGNQGVILQSIYNSSEGENLIENITLDSDVGLSIDVGENKFRLSRTSGSLRARIKYRQKYIGV
jgi:predicted phage tail component-like protein